jgi:hypothetical protein
MVGLARFTKAISKIKEDSPIEGALVNQVQKTSHSKAQHPIDKKKKQTREQDHENDERGGDERFAARRPGHFAGLGADLLQEFQRVSHCFDATEPLDVGRIPGPASNAAPPAVDRKMPPPPTRNESPDPGRNVLPKIKGAQPGACPPGLALIIERAANANSFFGQTLAPQASR